MATVSVEDPPAVTEVGFTLAVAPVGAPLVDRLTVAAAPAVTAVDTVAVADDPAVTLAPVGDNAIEKSLVAVALTVSENDTAGTWNPRPR